MSYTLTTAGSEITFGMNENKAIKDRAAVDMVQQCAWLLLGLPPGPQNLGFAHTKF